MPEPIKTTGGSYDAKTRKAADACRGHHRGRRRDRRRSSHHQHQKYAQQDAAAQQQQDPAYQQGVADAQAQQQQYAPPPPPHPAPAPAPAPAAPDLTAQLQQLAQLHNAGVLSDEEFAAAKQKLLAGYGLCVVGYRRSGRSMPRFGRRASRWATSEAGVLCESRFQSGIGIKRGLRCVPGDAPDSKFVFQPLHLARRKNHDRGIRNIRNIDADASSAPGG